MPTSLTDQVISISSRVEHTKASIYQTILKEYGDLFPSKKQGDLLLNIKPLLKDIHNLEEKFQNEIKPQIEDANTKHKDLVEEYGKSKEIIELLEIVCKCYKDLQLGKKNMLNREMKMFSHLKSAQHLDNAMKGLQNIKLDVCETKIFKLLRNEYEDLEDKLLRSFDGTWNSIVIWTTSLTASWDTSMGHLKTSLKIDHSPSGVDVDIIDLLESMKISSMLDKKLKSFSQKLFVHILKPLIKFQNLEANIQQLETNGMVLKIAKKGKSQKPFRHGHLLVYRKILDVVRFIKSSMFSKFYNIEDENTEKNTIDPIKLIGLFIWKDISDMLIADYLAAAVPCMNSQMEKYESTQKETIAFELELIKEGFIPPGTNSLSKYIKEVNVHFANKVCQDILSEARDLMLRELHNFMETNLDVDRAAMCLSDEDLKVLDKKIKNMMTGVESIATELLNADNIFGFPHCYISENVKLLMDFVYQTMIKATEAPYPIACQIFYSCRDIFELYINVVPTYHKENLKLPQQAALHYNNCMYLSHHCITLGHQFRNSLPDKLNSSMATFIDYVPILKKCGTDLFLEQLRMHQKELLNILDECNGFMGCESNEQAEPIQRALNQIIHYVTHLCKQWDAILPVNIFKQSIAVLYNTVLENIISSIFKIEDMSVEEAGQLHALFNSFVKRVIQSGTSEALNTSRISEHIRSLKKFEYMIKILEASLQEVVDLWGNGKDDLGKCMTEGEVRNLIRALFQNTERRARALAKIKRQVDAS